MRTDITDIVQRYRLTLRHIWNSCFWVDANLRTWESVYSFRDLKLPLFKALIADPLRIQSGDQIFGVRFQVLPDMKNSAGLSLLQVNSRMPSRPDEGTWEPLPGPFVAEDVRLTLVDLFDWSPLGYVDFRYYVVLMESLRQYPEKAGQHALVDVTEVTVVWSNSAE